MLFLGFDPSSLCTQVLHSITVTKYSLQLIMSHKLHMKASISGKGVYLWLVCGLKKEFKQVLLYTNTFNAQQRTNKTTQQFVTTNLELPDDECIIMLKYPINTCFGCQDSGFTKKECRQTDRQTYSSQLYIIAHGIPHYVHACC